MKKYKLFIFIVFLLVISVVLGYKLFFVSKSRTIKINQTEIIVEIADTPWKQTKGLSGRNLLLDDHGMLFLFDEPDYYSFWMKEMKFPIDIIWIDKNWQIVDITKNIPPESFPKTFQPQKPAQYVLEVNSGFAEKNNLKVGDKVIF